MNKDKFFIGGGPGKTGGTWLYRTLQQHPEVQMPPIKELNYFSIEQNIGKINVIDNLFSKKYLIKLKRKWSFLVLKNTIKPIFKLKRINWRNIYWIFIYFCLPPNDNWYKKLFPKNKLSGDISPTYSRISEETIKNIRNINPNAKIIIGLRNPIERTWSAIKMMLVLEQGKKSILEVEKEKIYTVFKRGNIFLRNNHTEILKKWGWYFSENQILVYYYEELEENPQELFNKICKFLEIEPIKIEGINKKVNKGIVEEIPTEYEKEIIKHTYKYIKEFAKAYPNKYSLAWLKKYKDYE